MASWVIELLIVFLFVAISIYAYFFYKFTYWKRKKVSYIRPTIPFGNFSPVIYGKLASGSVVARMYNELRSRGAKFGGYYALTEPNLLLVDLELIKTILNKDFNNFSERGMHYDEDKDPLSAHLIALRNPKWHFLRKKFSPTFTPAKMKMMFPLMMACGEQLKQVFEEKSKLGKPVHVQDILARFTTDIIGNCTYGIETTSLTEQNNEFRKKGIEFFNGTLQHSVVFSLALCAPHFSRLFKFSLIPKSVTDFFLNVMKETVEFREKHNVVRMDMLNLLIKLKNNESIEDAGNKDDNEYSGSGITFNNLVAQAFVFFIGGFENSASAMTFCLYELALNQEIQNRLREDIINTTEKFGELSYENVSEMKYLHMVVYETLRKYPSIPFMNRECTADYIIPGTDVKIEKGTVTIVPTLGIHRDKEYYPNPDLFDPERFNDENKDKIPSGAFLSWGMGPRNCIGARFGLLQAKLGLAIVIKNFKFTIAPGMKLPLEISPRAFVLAFERILWLNVEKV